jgi:hypothetical protein
MGAARKLQQEIDLVLKKVKEGTVAFDDIHDKVREHVAKASTRTTQDPLSDLSLWEKSVFEQELTRAQVLCCSPTIAHFAGAPRWVHGSQRPNSSGC